MIIKTTNNAVRLDGIRSLLVCDNEIYASKECNNYKLILSLATPEQVQYYFRGLLTSLTSDSIFCVDDDDFWTIPSPSQSQRTGAYVCNDGMLVRIDDVDRVSICIDDSKSVILECPDGGYFRYVFATDDDATFAYNTILEHILVPGVLLLEYFGSKLMAYKIK